MNEATIQAITAELLPLLKGKRLGKIFPLSRLSLAVDFRLADGRWLFMAFDNDPAPRIYLIKRRVKDLEKSSRAPSPFILLLKKYLGNAVLTDLARIKNERIVRFEFLAEDELGERKTYTLLAQLTGRSADLSLLDTDGRIVDSLRDTERTGEKYAPPTAGVGASPSGSRVLPYGRAADTHATLSEALDSYYQKLAAEKIFAARAKAAVDEVKREIKKREKLRDNLRKDLESHGDVEQHKRLGDLLLANTGAEVKNGRVTVTDFYREEMPPIEIEIKENLTPAQAAQEHFARYSKARRAAQEIPKRIVSVSEEIIILRRQLEKMQGLLDTKDTAAFEHFIRKKDRLEGEKPAKKPKEPVSGARSFVSSDGFEILVGRGAKDNDSLTFRTAKSRDLWLHAADYPGSHVIVRNPARKEIPPKTLLEAAQLAAFYSQAKKESKAAVNYTQQKNVSKIKGGAPGLVRISSFKTIMVEPKKIGG